MLSKKDAGIETGSYRADIEGLRAVAILLVVACHARVPGFDGGFIGVDMFFVLSGYLITGLLVAEYNQSDRIDFVSFYVRRLRRLLPALLTMLAVTAFAAWWLLPINHQSDQAIAGVAASLWASNIHFSLAELEYFGAAAESNIYLHTWSLGVEEQFYLIWPLLTIFLISRHKTAGPNRRVLFLGMLALLIASFLLNLLLMQLSSRYAFYLMPARAWQFTVGAIISIGASASVPVNRALREIAGVVGIALIAVSVALLDSNSPYPGVRAIAPTMAAACLIFAGIGVGETLITRVLSLGIMQSIGRVSYSWYLWHWPVLLLGASVMPVIDGLNKVLLVSLSLLLAVIAFALVEKPVRRNANAIRNPVPFLYASLLVIAGTAAVLFSWGSTSRFEAGQANDDIASKAFKISMPIIYQLGCDDWYHSDRVVACTFGSDVAPKTAVALGDSIGLQWFPALLKIFVSPDWRLIVLTKSSCPMVDRPIYYARIGREYTECAVWRQRVVSYLRDIRPQYVVLGSTHGAAYSQADWIRGTRDLLSQISPVADHLAVLRSTPGLPFNAPDCLSSKRRLQRLFDWQPPCTALDRDSRGEQIASWLSGVVTEFPNAQFIDMNDLICPNKICSAARNGELVFRDNQHLNGQFVEGLANPLASRLGVVSQINTKVQ